MPPKRIVAPPADPTLVEVPEENGNTPVMALPRDAKNFFSYAKYPYTLLWNPAEMYVGRIVSGGQIGPGTISFQPTEGATLTFYNKNGALVPNGIPAVFQGGGGSVICTAKTQTSATIRVLYGEFGSPQLQMILPEFSGVAQNQPGVTQVISYSAHAVEYDFDPAVYSPLGYTREFAQVGPGTLKLVPRFNATVIFFNPLNEQVDDYTIHQGEKVSVTCISQSASTVTLQILK